MIEKKSFGIHDGKEVFCCKLTNSTGLSAEVISYGAILKNLTFNGTDVVLGRDSLEEYLNNDGYFGATIGRNSNRIADAKFILNGAQYTLAENSEKVNIHGGVEGFSDKVWSVEEAGDENEPAVIFTYFSADGEEGYPGNLDVSVTYTLTKDNSLKIEYRAKSDKDTLVNLTNHSYFNLNGHDSGKIDNHTMQINADFFTPLNKYSVPTGEVLKVEGTPFDFRAPKTIAKDWNEDKQVTDFGGYDHNFAVRGHGFRLAAVTVGDKSGITMETYTDLPGVQLYTGNFIEEDRVCKGGAVYAPHGALCLETQFFPDAPNKSHFPSSVLKAEEDFYSCTEFKFR